MTAVFDILHDKMQNMTNEDIFELLGAASEMGLENQNGNTKVINKKDVFLLQSYNRWAAKELKKYAQTQDQNEIMLYRVSNFRDKMDRFACSAKTEESKYLFSSAYDFATAVLDFILTK